MNTFVFDSKLRIGLIAAMAIGVLCLVSAYVTDTDPYHSRFWSNVLLNTVFFTGIAFIALFFYSANLIGLSGWHTTFKRVWESFYLFIAVGVVLMAIVGYAAYAQWNHLYHWAIPSEVQTDEILQGKSAFLNFKWYFLATLGFGGLWTFIGLRLRALSKKEDKYGSMDYSYHKRMRIWAAIFLPLGGFTSAAAIWLWIMSVDAHWYSTLFAWYNGASWLVAMLALTILLLFYLKSKGYYESVTNEHIHDLGKYLFAISIFWTYLWFSQYMLIWYANNGEETVYFKTRLDQFPVLFYANVVINFVLPFLVLMRNDTKRKVGTMVFASIMVFFGHWLDIFLMVKPGVLHTKHEYEHHQHGAEGHGGDHGEAVGHGGEHGAEGAEQVVEAAVGHSEGLVEGFTLPGFLEIGTMIGFLGLFLFFVFTMLSRAKLVPPRDPYLEESKHHHV